MKLPLSWIAEWIQLNIPPHQIASSLTRAGLEVDSVCSFARSFDQVVVGKVVATAPHPRADRLKIATVTDGRDEYQVVCGAPNCREGMKTAFARVGATLRNERGESFQIEEVSLKGVVSSGMLCSEKELEIGSQQDGILELASQFQEGADVAEIFADEIFEISLTPNLGHCASVLGVARELSAICSTPLTPPPRSPLAEGKREISKFVSVEVKDQKRCPHYACRLIRGVSVAPSPDWLKRRLIACDIRPVNAVVDVTNYVLFELGHPLHAFDFSRVQGGKIVVRTAEKGEELISLDGKTRNFCSDDLLICDEESPIAIAGVMGGKDSEVSDETVDVLLESAYFEPRQIRKTSKRHSMQTEASKRFERGCDPESVLTALDRAAQLIVDVAGGETIKGVVQSGSSGDKERVLQCRMSRINAILGTQLSISEVEGIFQRLEMGVKWDGVDTFTLLTPSYRVDLMAEIDLIEEVARVYGFENIPKVSPKYTTSSLPHAPIFLFEEEVRGRLISFGLQEFLTCDLIGSSARDLVKESLMPEESLVKVKNPTSQEQSILRTSLLPGLLQVVKHNQDHQNPNIFGFEIGRIHFRKSDLFKEQSMAALILSGQTRPHHFSEKERALDFFDLKGYVEDFIQSLHVGKPRFEPSDLEGFHPGRQASVVIDSLQVGTFGEIHPSSRRALDVQKRIFFAEFDLHDLLTLRREREKILPLSLYPASARDLTLTVSDSLPVQHLIDCVEQVECTVLERVELLDVYRGEQAGEGKKNVTLHFIYRSQVQTISQEEVDKAHTQIASALQAQVY